MKHEVWFSSLLEIPFVNITNFKISSTSYSVTCMLQTDLTRHNATFVHSLYTCSSIEVLLLLALTHTQVISCLLVVCVAVCDVWLCLCSYAGSVATMATTAGASTPSMDYLDQLDDFNIDYNGLVNLNELMEYKQ